MCYPRTRANSRQQTRLFLEGLTIFSEAEAQVDAGADDVGGVFDIDKGRGQDEYCGLSLIRSVPKP